MIMYKM